MLSAENNDLITRVGHGTPMGSLMRQYWLPLIPSSDIDPNGDPQRVRLLGEDLVLFRATDGKLGLVAEACPHRGASLFFGRNEEDGLRCVYHGWKYDVTGQCVDMPNEPEESNFKNKIRVRGYAVEDRGSVVWAYMGEGDPPGLPEFEWTLVSEEQRRLTVSQRHCNWLQALEGDIDTSHLFFLHGRLNPTDSSAIGVWHDDRHPRLEIVPTDYGVVYGANREENPSTTYWRITQFMFPIFAFFPANPDGSVPGHIWVPLDDYTTRVWSLVWHPTLPLTETTLGVRVTASPAGPYLPDDTSGLGRFRPRARKENDYEIDREIQRTKTFTGIPTINLQDQAVTESMGPIVNRTIEHLGTSDGMIIQVRRKLLNAAIALRDSGTAPPCVEHPEWYTVRSCSATLPKGASWHTELHDWLYAKTSDIPECDLAVAR
jgi:phenylpropionate dioxygenase-like ring-hydroxylating dioxygenase large terminal subunit